VSDETLTDRPELAEKLAELDILRQSLEASKAKEKDVYDQLLRLGAELENFRKRSEIRIQDARRAGREDVLLPVISIVDSLIQAENATKNATDVEAVKKGLVLVHQQFEKFLKDQGLVSIKTVGEKLDPHRHEVIAQDVREDSEDGIILDEIQRGYMLQDRLVRPARVRVAVKPSSMEPRE
jgi:molecular chaperone GrpE